MHCESGQLLHFVTIKGRLYLLEQPYDFCQNRLELYYGCIFGLQRQSANITRNIDVKVKISGHLLQCACPFAAAYR